MTGGTLPIADMPEDLTPSWLTGALTVSRVLDGARVVNVTFHPIGTGQMCDCVRLDVDYDRPTDAPRSIVAKLPAADETSRATAKALHSYETEVRFYQQLAAELPIRTPHAYYAEIDVESASFVLLLEDLAPARQGDQLRGCSVERRGSQSKSWSSSTHRGGVTGPLPISSGSTATKPPTNNSLPPSCPGYGKGSVIDTRRISVPTSSKPARSSSPTSAPTCWPIPDH